MRDDELAGLERHAIAGGQGNERTVALALLRARRSPAAAADSAHRAVDRAIGRVEDLHRAAFDWAELAVDGGSATEHASTLCVRDDAPTHHMHRMAELVHFDAIDVAHASVADMDDREEAVSHGRRRATADADMHLVDERRIVAPRVFAGDNAHARRLDRPRLGLPVAGRGFRNGAVRG